LELPKMPPHLVSCFPLDLIDPVLDSLLGSKASADKDDESIMALVLIFAGDVCPRVPVLVDVDMTSSALLLKNRLFLWP
jgi:hypothetical protein